LPVQIGACLNIAASTEVYDLSANTLLGNNVSVPLDYLEGFIRCTDRVALFYPEYLNNTDFKRVTLCYTSESNTTLVLTARLHHVWSWLGIRDAV